MVYLILGDSEGGATMERGGKVRNCMVINYLILSPIPCQCLYVQLVLFDVLFGTG